MRTSSPVTDYSLRVFITYIYRIMDMNETLGKTEQQQDDRGEKKFRHPIHPYFKSNSSEETIRRMREFPERAAKFLEQWRADRTKDSR